MSTSVVNGYRPSNDEKFMNERQQEYFRRKLLDWKQDILRESQGTLNNLQEDDNHMPDVSDRARANLKRRLNCVPVTGNAN